MRLGVFMPRGIPESFRVYTQNVMQGLTKSGVAFRPFDQDEPPPIDVDLYWDPRSGGGHAPCSAFRSLTKPYVVTVHGLAPIALRPWEYFDNLRDCVYGVLENRKKFRRWRTFGTSVRIITVSEHTKSDVERYLNLDNTQVTPVYHGVDHDLFSPGTAPAIDDGYLLHISNNEPRKNIARIISAHARLPRERRPRLVIKAPNVPVAAGAGIEVIGERLSDDQIGALYRGALAFVFPSLYEGFGLPILEAMASGCPVITSDTSACPEVAGDSALIVNPRSVSEISSAMLRVCSQPDTRERLREIGLQRAQAFTWEACADGHLAVFEQTLNGRVRTPEYAEA